MNQSEPIKSKTRSQPRTPSASALHNPPSVPSAASFPAAVERIGWPDRFVTHGNDVATLRVAHGLAPDDIYRCVLARWRNLRPVPVEAVM